MSTQAEGADFSHYSHYSRISQDAFYGPAGDIVHTIDPHTEADPVAVLGTFLVSFGNATGPGPHILVGATRHEPRLFLVLVGDTSKARKGQSWDEVRRLFGIAEDGWVRERVTTGLSSGEGLIWEVRDEIWQWDQRRGSLVLVDNGVDDKRLLVVEPEFARTLRVMGREGNVLSPVLRAAWDDGNLRVMSRNTPAKASRAHISILGHITVAELTMELGASDAFSGFANRFLWIKASRSKLLPRGGCVPPEEVSRLATSLHDALAFASGVGEMQFSERGGQLWDEMYKELSAEMPGMAGAMLARSEAQCLRLSMIYALLNKSAKIEVPHVKAALAFWDQCRAAVHAICGEKMGDPVADRLLAAIRERDRTKDEMYQLLGRGVLAERLNAALRSLEAAGLIEQVPDLREGKGRPREVWRVTTASEKNEINENNPRT